MPLGNDFWYGKLLHIGPEGGYPILTFTSAGEATGWWLMVNGSRLAISGWPLARFPR